MNEFEAMLTIASCPGIISTIPVFHEFKELFMMNQLSQLTLADHWKIYIKTLISGLIIGLVFTQFSETIVGKIGMVIGFGLMIGAFVWQILFLKCPKCGYRFHLKRPLRNYCPACGEMIV